MIAIKNITLYIGCLGFTTPRERAELGQRQVGQVPLLSISSQLLSYRRRLRSCHFRVTEICVMIDRQSPQGLKLQKSLRLPSRNYLVYLLILKRYSASAFESA